MASLSPSLNHLKPWLELRIVRYGMVGALGVPINNAALIVFLFLTRGVFWLSLPLAFEVSTVLNFVLNQRFTYREQTHLRGWDWPRRALKAQISSISAIILAMGIAFALKYGLHVETFLATDIGIMLAFFYNFALSRRIVFQPAKP